MASWSSALTRIARELEQQGAVVRTAKDGKVVAYRPGNPERISFHRTPGHAAQSRHNVRQKFELIGCTLPEGFKL